MTEQHSDPDDDLVEAISAYLDDELDAPVHAEVARRVETDAEAARVLALLRGARDAASAESAALLPTVEERTRLDSVVLDPDSTRPPERAPVVTPMRARRQSPRKQGRPALPYFAAAALIAVVLSAGLALLVPKLSNRSDDVAGNAIVESATTTAPAQDASGSAGAAAESAPQPAAPAANDGPALFVASVDATEPADLAALLAAAPPVAADKAAARSDLAATAGGVDDDAGLDALGACLDAAPITVSRVDTGNWQGTPAFFLSGGPGPGAASQVIVLRMPDCAVLATYP